MFSFLGVSQRYFHTPRQRHQEKSTWAEGLRLMCDGYSRTAAFGTLEQAPRYNMQGMQGISINKQEEQDHKP
jgi:hypothetical protein